MVTNVPHDSGNLLNNNPILICSERTLSTIVASSTDASHVPKKEDSTSGEDDRRREGETGEEVGASYGEAKEEAEEVDHGSREGSRVIPDVRLQGACPSGSKVEFGARHGQPQGREEELEDDHSAVPS